MYLKLNKKYILDVLESPERITVDGIEMFLGRIKLKGKKLTQTRQNYGSQDLYEDGSRLKGYDVLRGPYGHDNCDIVYLEVTKQEPQGPEPEQPPPRWNAPEPPPRIPPGPPTNLRNEGFDVSWSPPSELGTSPETLKYIVTLNGQDPTVIADRFFTILSGKPGTVSVASVTEDGESEPATIDIMVPPPPPPPEPEQPKPKKLSRGAAIKRLEELKREIENLKPSRKDQRERFNYYTQNIQKLLQDVPKTVIKPIDDILLLIKDIEFHLTQYYAIQQGGYRATRKRSKLTLRRRRYSRRHATS
jgi:hypothetical protein